MAWRIFGNRMFGKDSRVIVGIQQKTCFRTVLVHLFERFLIDFLPNKHKSDPEIFPFPICFWAFFSRGVLRYFTQTWRNNSFRCLLQRLPRPQDVGHLCLRYCKFFNLFYNLNCSAWERATWRRVTEKSYFSTLNVGLAGTGNRTQATCLAGSVTRRSAIHYALVVFGHF
jgi:hypothetical protein